MVDIILKDHKTEGLVSWTTDVRYAEIFKGLYRENAVTAAIFERTPTKEDVILNLIRVILLQVLKYLTKIIRTIAMQFIILKRHKKGLFWTRRYEEVKSVSYGVKPALLTTSVIPPISRKQADCV